jgi:hypothetical protein
MNITKNMYFGGTKANTAAMNTRNRATLSVACRTDVKLKKDYGGGWLSNQLTDSIWFINHTIYNIFHLPNNL